MMMMLEDDDDPSGDEAAALGCCGTPSGCAGTCCQYMQQATPWPPLHAADLQLVPPQAFFVDGDGYVLEAPTANIGIITHDRKLVVPPFDACIAGITMQRIMELVGEVRCVPEVQLSAALPACLPTRLHTYLNSIMVHECVLCFTELGGMRHKQNHHLSNEPRL